MAEMASMYVHTRKYVFDQLFRILLHRSHAFTGLAELIILTFGSLGGEILPSTVA